MIWELTECVQEISVTNSSVVFQKKSCLFLLFLTLYYFIVLFYPASSLLHLFYVAWVLMGIFSVRNLVLV